MGRKLDKKQKEIILSWHKLATNTEETNFYFKFIAEWIAFNAICYALYYTDAQKISTNLEDDTKYENIIINLHPGGSRRSNQAILKRGEKNSKVKITFPQPDNTILTLEIGSKRYREDEIFNQFVENYRSRYEEKNMFFGEFQELKESLKKEDALYYVINMARIDDYNKIIESEDHLIEDLMKSGTVKFCDENRLSIVKDVLYQIRCNIFHGEKLPGELNDDRIVKAAYPLLNEIVKFLICDLKIEDK